jgi:hypothetical protein
LSVVLRLIPTQTGGQRYSDTSPFSIPCIDRRICRRRDKVFRRIPAGGRVPLRRRKGQRQPEHLAQVAPVGPDREDPAAGLVPRVETG